MSLPGRMTERLYRAALRLLPAPIRRKHGDAMVALFRRQLERARDRGRGAWLRAGGAGLIDVVGRALYERVRPSPEHGGGSVLSSLAQDVRYAFRTLRRSPRFTVLAVLTLALGIGANSALFSVVYGVVLRPLPFPDAERVTHLGWDRGGPPRGAVPAYKVEYWSEHTEAFEAVTTWRSTSVELGEDGSGDAVGALRVTSAFLDVVGWEPVLGRGFTEADDRPGAPDVALLGHGLWRTRFGGDRDVLGRTLQVDGRPHTVVGVLPADFTFPQAPDRDGVLLPLRLQADPRDEGENWE
ncbi:MAG TPA: ABC transporter permease, partial [Longimicrobiales bacterium]|nr:ABC transporter permease [Longimicrobiales bacterium]